MVFSLDDIILKQNIDELRQNLMAIEALVGYSCSIDDWIIMKMLS